MSKMISYLFPPGDNRDVCPRQDGGVKQEGYRGGGDDGGYHEGGLQHQHGQDELDVRAFKVD